MKKLTGTTGPVLITGAVIWANSVAVGRPGTPVDWVTLPAATGIAAVVMRLAEGPLGSIARTLAWTMLITAFIAPIQGRPSPVETIIKLSRNLGVPIEGTTKKMK
jgi:hypothetical protein